ncbi:toll/interleukin-1 receptor domain-containing protein [Rhizobium tubonense]|uniref:TIR domain-containing protein n=1 Tax=Rhizobium tubonense TaxID=484088 RepID=A0A2W4C3J8_9HYPH|nr:toll/interleukin-1 receptor domain-containing protein [Rhizobium tubonense]PZM08067.1 hypothetical protein CPY51_30450 [Rhizobium tubonense]
MKIFIIGGTTLSENDERFAEEMATLDAAMGHIGRDIVQRGHDLVACSPFEGSADFYAIGSAAKFLSGSDGACPVIEMHSPNDAGVTDEVRRLMGRTTARCFQPYAHPVAKGPNGEINWNNSWLLSQLAALDSCHAVVAIGGKMSGSANLLLTLATSKSKPIVPLPFLGGAAETSWIDLRFGLDDFLKERMASLSVLEGIGTVVQSVEELANNSMKRADGQPKRVFISYARSRPKEADFVEMTLRRRHFEVFRDERDFGAGRELSNEIKEHMERSNIFIAIWCNEYACSPWCFDELDAALQRQREDKTQIWILRVDDTRVVPPAARQLVTYPSTDRAQLEGNILRLIESSNL